MIFLLWFLMFTITNGAQELNDRAFRTDESKSARAELNCSTDNDCNRGRTWQIRSECKNGVCLCSGSSVKIGSRCRDVLGLPCAALGQCEKYVENSVCDMTGSGRCECKNGYKEEEDSSFHYKKCSPILGRTCDENDNCRGILNAECVLDLEKPDGKKVCKCVEGLRPNNRKDRELTLRKSPQKWLYAREEDQVSTSCEVVIGNDCNSDTCCKNNVNNSHCGVEDKLCTCDDGFLFDSVTKLCHVTDHEKVSKKTSKKASVLLQDGTLCPNGSCGVRSDSRIGKPRMVLDVQCFLIYYPCILPHSVCTPDQNIPYRGTCQCELGYVATDQEVCTSIQEVPQAPVELIPETTTTTASAEPVEEQTTSTEAQYIPTPATTPSVQSPSEGEQCGQSGNIKSAEFGLDSQFGTTLQTRNQASLNRIVGGKDALANEICWQAGVLSYAEDGQSYEYCGGSILNSKWVVTAMHCVVQNDDVTQLTPVDRMYVAVGALSFPQSKSDGYCGSYVRAKKIVVQPSAEFVMDGQNFMGIANDLALIELDTELDFTHPCICPICLPTKRPAPDENCIVSGFGCQDAACVSPPPHSLAWLKVPIIAKDSPQCQHGTDKLSTDNIVCIGSTKTGDACTGDSGGPLTCYDAARGRYYLAGATSYGFGDPPKNCAAGELTRYTDVASYVDWIKQTINQPDT